MVGYGGAMWKASLASSYGLETDLVNHGAERQVKTQSITASLRPHESLTITPTLGYRAEQQEWSAGRIDSPSASLSMNYTQSPRMNFSATGNYSGLRSSDKLDRVGQHRRERHRLIGARTGKRLETAALSGGWL